MSRTRADLSAVRQKTLSPAPDRGPSAPCAASTAAGSHAVISAPKMHQQKERRASDDKNIYTWVAFSYSRPVLRVGHFSYSSAAALVPTWMHVCHPSSGTMPHICSLPNLSVQLHYICMEDLIKWRQMIAICKGKKQTMMVHKCIDSQGPQVGSAQHTGWCAQSEAPNCYCRLWKLTLKGKMEF
jgi:hypothetical protein